MAVAVLVVLGVAVGLVGVHSRMNGRCESWNRTTTSIFSAIERGSVHIISDVRRKEKDHHGSQSNRISFTLRFWILDPFFPPPP